MDFETIRARLKARRPRRAHAPKATPAAVALILARGDKDLDVLLIKRAEHPRDPWSGQMALPGGRSDEGEEDLFATALRETFEETGIRLPRQFLLGDLDDLHPRSKTLPPVIVRPFVFGLPARPEVRPSPEVAGLVWVSLSGLKASACRIKLAIGGEEREVRAYRFGPYIVWGMTERILRQFLGA